MHAANGLLTPLFTDALQSGQPSSTWGSWEPLRSPIDLGAATPTPLHSSSAAPTAPSSSTTSTTSSIHSAADSTSSQSAFNSSHVESRTSELDSPYLSFPPSVTSDSNVSASAATSSSLSLPVHSNSVDSHRSPPSNDSASTTSSTMTSTTGSESPLPITPNSIGTASSSAMSTNTRATAPLHHVRLPSLQLTPQQMALAMAEQQAHRAADAAEEDGEEDDEDGPIGPNGVVSESKMKRGHGSSCHQCKTTKDEQFLLFCTNKAEKGVRKRRCRKKYCDSCLKRSYGSDISEVIPSWQCPSCLAICICAACHRKNAKKNASAGVGAGVESNQHHHPHHPHHHQQHHHHDGADSASQLAMNQAVAAAEAIRSAALQERRQSRSDREDSSVVSSSPDPLAIPHQMRRSSSNSSVRISLSPLTISRTISNDPHKPPQDARRLSVTAPPGADIRISPRFPGRTLFTGKGNSSSCNSLASLESQSLSSSTTSTAVVGLDLDPSVQQNDELERLMVGMNMAQRQTFLHDAANLHAAVMSAKPPSAPNSIHSSPRASPRSIKRKSCSTSAGGVGGPITDLSPTHQVNFHMRQRLKSHLASSVASSVAEDAAQTNHSNTSSPRGLPPSHSRRSPQVHTITPSALSVAQLTTSPTPSTASVTSMPTPLSGGFHLPPAASLHLSMPSTASHLTDDSLNGPPLHGQHHHHHHQDDATNNGILSPPTSMFTSTAAELTPGQANQQYEWKHTAPLNHSHGHLSEHHVPAKLEVKGDSHVKPEPHYLEWGAGGPTPNPSFLSPLPGSLMLHFPLPVPSTPGFSAANTSLVLGSPNPVNAAFANAAMATPGGYSSTGSSSFFSPNTTRDPSSSPSVAMSSPSPYGSTFSFPSYLPPAPGADVFQMRQLSLNGQNFLMADGMMERGLSAIGGPLHADHNISGSINHASADDKGIPTTWGFDATAWRQTSANAVMTPTPSITAAS